MTHHDFQFFIVLVASLDVCSFVSLSAIPRTRSGGLIGLVGSALLLFAVVRGDYFHDTANIIAFEIIGGVLLLVSGACLLASGVRAIKRRTA